MFIENPSQIQVIEIWCDPLKYFTLVITISTDFPNTHCLWSNPATNARIYYWIISFNVLNVKQYGLVLV